MATKEEQIDILAGDDDLLRNLYKSSDAALAAAWKKYREQQPQPTNGSHPHPQDVLVDPDAITDLPSEVREEDLEIDGILDGVDILDAYTRWCNKSQPKVGGKREGIMVSCPKPDHPDHNPSAWVNLDKQTWFCGGCQEGGDKFDIAAYHFGYPVPGYKVGKSFPDLRRDMAVDLGYVVRRTRSGKTFVEPLPEHEPDPELAEEEETEPPGFLAPVISILGEPDPEIPSSVVVDVEKLRNDPLYVDWEAMKLDGTFLGDWMEGCCVDHVPDEYSLFMGMQAMGFAVGMNRLGHDDMNLIKPAMYVVLYGGTGVGKSRSMSPMYRILRDVLPWPDRLAEGVVRVSTPGSGEALIDNLTFRTEISGGTIPVEVEASRAWLANDEFSTIATIANRRGSTLKTVLMELHDLVSGTAKDTVAIHSRAHGTVIAKDKFFQITSTVQPKAIGTFASDIDVMTGFMNRWVFVMGHMRRPPSPRPPAKSVSAATARLESIRDWAHEPKLVEMTPAAFNAWADFYMDKIAPAVERIMAIGGNENDASMSDAFVARLELTLKKMALFFAINEESDVIEEHHVLLATSLARYFNRSMMQVSSDFVWTFSTEVEDAVISYLSKRSAKDTRMKNIADTLRTRFTRTDISRAVATLVDLGLVEENITKGKRGPGAVGYALAASDGAS